MQGAFYYCYRALANLSKNDVSVKYLSHPVITISLYHLNTPQGDLPLVPKGV